MSEVTFIKGKEASLEESISFMQAILQQQGIQIEQANALNPVENIYSLHIFDRACPSLFTNGKGASEKATLASALGEYLERLSTNYFFSDYYLQPVLENQQAWLYFPHEKTFNTADYRACLTPDLWAMYDPHQEWMAEHLYSFNDDAPLIRALPLRDTSSNKIVYFPMNLLSNLYASNGLSAGNTAEEAYVQGLSEIFERWVKNKILRENLCLPEVPQAVLARFPTVFGALGALADQGLAVSVRDASLGGQFPVINVTLFDTAHGRCFASFGAHPLFEVALERALTESLQGRHLTFLDGFQVPTFDLQAVAEAENLENHFIDSSGLLHARFLANEADFEFVDWNWAGTCAQQWTFLVQLVESLGHRVYVGDYAHYGFNACRLIVPGMSEVYPLDELLVKNQNDGRHLRQALDAFVDGATAQSVLDIIDEIGFSDHQGVASLVGLMPDAGSDWADLKIADLRFWLQLAKQDWHEAFEALQVAKAFVHPEKPMAKVFEAFGLLLEIKLDDLDYAAYQPGLLKLFGATTLTRVEQHFSGEQVAWGIPLGQAAFDHSTRHQAMLTVYSQAGKTKAAFYF